jgi:hypothetical protein
LLAARDKLRYCAGEACPELLRNRCLQWLREVQRELPSIIVVAKDPRGRDTSDVRLEIDGELVTERLDGLPVLVDPGEHTLRLRYRDLPPVERKLLIRQGKKNREVVVRFSAPRSAADPKRADRKPARGADQADADAEQPEEEDGPSVSPLVAVGFGTAGAALVVGLVTGIVSLVDGADLQERCPDDVCTRDKEAELDNGLTVAHVSTVSFVVSGVGAVVGVLGLILTDWNGEEEDLDATGLVVRPLIGPGSIGLGGRF